MAEGPEVLIERTLNEVLTRINQTDDRKREVERDARQLSTRLDELEREAKGLRLALFALAGQPMDEAEANKINTKTRHELRSART